MTTTGKQLNECGHELNTDVELVAGDVNGTNFKRSLNMKLLFAWSPKHLGDACKRGCGDILDKAAMRYAIGIAGERSFEYYGVTSRITITAQTKKG